MFVDSLISTTMAEGFTKEELEFFKLMKAQVKELPKVEETENVHDWMKGYLSTSGALQPKKEQDAHQHTPQNDDKGAIHKFREPPRISTFSGNNNKGETTYELWRYEVCGLMEDKLYTPDNISYAVRRSLKGDAGTIAMHLGAKASPVEIINKLDSIFGDVGKKEELLAQFYRAKQADDESVTKWSCRLENIIGRAVDRGVVHKSEVNSMLHSMLWTGLKTELKDISGHKFDSIKDFDELRVALRQIETDHEERKPTRKPNPSKAATPTNDSQMDRMEGMIHQLTTRMDRWETDFRGRGGRRRNFRGRQRYNYQHYSDPPPSEEPNTQPQEVDRSEWRCKRCGQKGHLKIGCTAKLPNRGRGRGNLNSQQSMEQGRP